MADENTPLPASLAKHAGCRICADQTRAGAYRWIGERHWIPGIHGANWLGDDLRLTLERLALGEEVELDYRGSVDGAPRIALHRSPDDVISAQGPDGWLEAVGRTRWTWQPGVDPVERIERIAFTLLSYIKGLRGAPGVILVEPGGH